MESTLPHALTIKGGTMTIDEWNATNPVGTRISFDVTKTTKRYKNGKLVGVDFNIKHYRRRTTGPASFRNGKAQVPVTFNKKTEWINVKEISS